MISAVNHRPPLSGNNDLAMKGKFYFLLILIFCSKTQMTLSQPSSAKHTFRIGLFVPLYLDSAFDKNSTYRFPPKSFPKFSMPGLELVEGAFLAMDTLNKLKAPIELMVVDTRATAQSLLEQLKNASSQNLDLIITHCSTSELQTIAAFGYEKNIPVVNINLPNDAGVTNNPFLVLLNSTLRTQSIAIYNYVQTKFPKQPVVVFRKKGKLEDMIRGYWDETAKTNKSPQKWIYVDLPDSFTEDHLISKLDTIRQTICIAGSLDEAFGKKLVLHLATLSKQRYKSTIVGMPTWDAIREFSKPEFRGVDIIFCTPYYNDRTDSVSQQVQRFFINTLYARPSDLALRGYEAVWRFSRLLMRYGNGINSQLAANEFDLFREIQIHPVFSTDKQLQYFENKKLYFFKWQYGILKLLP
jgi:hypothetical protein